MAELSYYWPTPILRKAFPEAAAVNPELIARFEAERRAAQPAGGAVYSSADDVLERYPLPALQQLFGFISQSVYEVARSVNGHIWQRLGVGRLRMQVVGAWFQMQNRHGFHDIHSHGNCSWSGVYYLQIDPLEQRTRHPQLGALNGVTRFYSPRFDLLGGAHIDLGNAYLQESHLDVQPEAGMLIVFPSWLNHKAMPYDGERDRIIISFNAQVHGERGDKSFEYGF